MISKLSITYLNEIIDGKNTRGSNTHNHESTAKNKQHMI